MPPYPNPIVERDGIRFFSDAGIQSSIDKALSSVTKDSAVVEFQNNKTGFNAAVATKIGDRWSIVVGYQKDGWGHGVGGKVRFEFGK